MTKSNHFEELHALGYKQIIPIIPHNAELSKDSKVKQSDRGKVPGRKNGMGNWGGFKNWQDFDGPDEADMARWAKWGAGVGIRCGQVIAFDIDVMDPVLSEAIAKCITRMAGDTPARTGRKPKVLLVYRVSAELTKRRMKFSYEDTEHAVELLGRGQQFVAHGIHPGTGMRYRWNTESKTMHPIDNIYQLTPDMVDAIWDSIRALIVQKGGSILDEGRSTTSSGKRNSLGADDTVAPDMAIAQAAVEAMPNKLDYDEWIKMCAAIKAAFGGDENYYPVFEEWCLKYPGATAEDARKRWDSITSSELGINYLLDHAREHGFTDTSEFAEAEGDDIGIDRTRAKAKEEMFSRYVWVEELKRFADTVTGQLLDMQQFNVRMAVVGNPSNSKNCASTVFYKDLGNRQTVWGVTYVPGGALFVEEEGRTYINTWKPGTLKMPELVTDEDVRPWLNLVEHVIPDSVARDIVLDWASFAVSQPYQKCNWAVLLGSTVHGIGKDMMFQPVIKALGSHNVKYVGPADIAGGYTDWAAGAKLIVVEEMHSFERKETMNKIKAYIASPPDKIRVNAKYIPQYQVPNIGAYLFFTNMHNALALEKEDRRFFVYWSPARRADDVIYANVVEWYENGGYGKVARWLHQRDIMMFDAKGKAPDSEHKDEMRRAANGPLEEWVETGMEEGLEPFDCDLINIDELMYQLPARIERLKPSRERLVALVRLSGGRNIGRFRLTSARLQSRVWSLRNHGLYANMGNDKIKAVFDDHKDVKKDEFEELI